MEYGYTVLKWFNNDSGAYAVLLQIDNGDTQYLSINDYKAFLENKIKK